MAGRITFWASTIPAMAIAAVIALAAFGVMDIKGPHVVLLVMGEVGLATMSVCRYLLSRHSA